MNPKTKVLVIGASGAVGNDAVYLLNKFGYQVLTAGRRPYSNSEQHFILDILDTPRLTAACYEADLVLNTAGPSTVIGTRIAKAALSAGKHYVDVAGTPSFELDLRQTHNEFPTACVLGSGYIPGFAAMLPDYAYHYFKVPTEITLYCGGIEVFTPTSAYDFLSSRTLDEHGKSGISWKKNNFCQASIKPAWQLSGLNRNFDAIPYLSFEHLQWIKKHQLPNFTAYNLVFDRRLLAITQNNAQAVDDLVKISQEVVQQVGEQQHLFMQVKGFLADQFSCLRLRIDFKNSYQLTGTVAALTVKQVLENPKKGLYWLHDYFDINQLIDLLKSHGLFDNYAVDIQSEDHHIPFEEGAI